MLNGIAPGVVYTPLSAPLFESPALMETVAKSNPIAVEDFCQPEDIAEMLDFLLNFEGRYTLGHIFFIDGGTERRAGEADTISGVVADDATRTRTVTLDAP